MKKRHLIFHLILMFILISARGHGTMSEETILLSAETTDGAFIPTTPDDTTVIHNVVIFIRFSDEASYTSPYDLEDFERLYNGTMSESLRDYYLEVSYGRLDITSLFASDGTQLVFYTDINPRSYYQPYDADTNPGGTKDSQQASREHALLKRAIDHVDALGLIDPALDLDVNGDGDIDALTFMVSGDSDDWNSLLWPHQWSLYSYYDFNSGSYDSDAPTINGVYAYDYGFNLIEAYDYETLLGVISHEMFHVLSAPDLYHYYDYWWLSPIGPWGLMDEVYGTPSHMLGYMKEAYGGWIDSVTTITESGTYTLSPLASGPENLLRIDTGYSNEFVYLEFRTKDGVYESSLPDEGLLVYRVDFDYQGLGNADGYYDEDGNPTDEVYLFRPNVSLDGPPYVFSDQESYDEDGSVEDAALSQFNVADAMGLGTSIPMFHSDGSVMDITIENVVVSGDTVTFDIRLPGQIELDTSFGIDPATDLFLLDLPGLSYSASVLNLLDDAVATYTTDGTVPDMNDTPVTGPIPLTASGNTITVAVFEDGVRIDLFSESFQFKDTIETAHDPYGNDVDTTWLVGFPSETSYDLAFSSRTETEADYDYIYIDDGTAVTAWDGTSLAGQTLSYTNDGLMIRFVSDEWLDDYYGFLATLTYEISGSVDLLGDASVTIEVGSLYEDQGATFTAPLPEGFTLDVISDVDAQTIGTYTVTWILLDASSAEVDRVTRTVSVVDTTDPVLTLLPGIDTLMTGETFTDGGVQVTDNYDTELTLVNSGTVDTDTPGTYQVAYIAVDTSGNSTRIVRVVTVNEPFDPVFECGVTQTTYLVGEPFTTPICTFAGDPVAPDVTGVDIENAGTYAIIYEATWKGVTFTHTTYVFYVNGPDTTVAMMPTRKEDLL
jgi:M6 family metalloprotease-like protein